MEDGLSRTLKSLAFNGECSLQSAKEERPAASGAGAQVETDEDEGQNEDEKEGSLGSGGR